MSALKLAILFTFDKEIHRLKLDEKDKSKFIDDVYDILNQYNIHRSNDAVLKLIKRSWSNWETDMFFNFKKFLGRSLCSGDIKMSNAYVTIREISYDYMDPLIHLIKLEEHE